MEERQVFELEWMRARRMRALGSVGRPLEDARHPARQLSGQQQDGARRAKLCWDESEPLRREPPKERSPVSPELRWGLKPRLAIGRSPTELQRQASRPVWLSRLPSWLASRIPPQLPLQRDHENASARGPLAHSRGNSSEFSFRQCRSLAGTRSRLLP